MLRKPFIIVLLACFVSASATVCGHAGWQDFLKEVTKAIQSDQGLSQGDIVAGLKEALQVGTTNVVYITSRLDGFYKNSQIRIPLPEKVRKIEEFLRMAGFGDQVTAFELSMNRAAEKAAPEAKALFMNAIGQMTFTDAKQILKGRDNEATLYFKDKTYQPLENRFKPLVHTAMSQVGVTRTFQQLNTKIQALPIGNQLSVDLDHYVTTKALDGLFFVLAQEEAKIRKDPAARVTELLKKVFGALK